MKINKKNPKHWLVIMISGLNIVIAIFLYIILKRNKSNSIVFYGHKLNGNLRPLAEYINNRGDFEVCFVTMDDDYYKKLMVSDKNIKILKTSRLRDVLYVVKSQAVITDRKANVLNIINKFTQLPFIDVWHGIPYKGFIPSDFKFLSKYKEVWVSSPKLKKIYEDTYLINNKKVFSTGYARADRLASGYYDVNSIKNKLGISLKYKNIVLVAPTWQQDEKGRNIIPFGSNEQTFFGSMNEIGKSTNTLFIFRAHLNVGDEIKISSLSNVINMSYSQYPDAEEFLAISDLLVTDWSSIAFDYLVLRRPTIFLDVKPPFKNNFTLGPEYRFGKLVDCAEDYLCALREYIDKPASFKKKYHHKIDEVIKSVYGNTLDGQTCKRQYDRLTRMINERS